MKNYQQTTTGYFKVFIQPQLPGNLYIHVVLRDFVSLLQNFRIKIFKLLFFFILIFSHFLLIKLEIIKIAGRNINNLRYVDDTTLMVENKEELKRLLMKVKEESEKVGLKLSIQRTKIMASGPITLWQIDGEKGQTVRNHFLGSKITADGDCSHEIKGHLLLGRKSMTNLDSILKSRDVTLPTKVHLVKVMVLQQLCMDVRVVP